jgi:hypothetical protein
LLGKIFMFGIIALWAGPAHADFFYKLVGYECNEKTNSVILIYNGALNETGLRMIKNKGPRQWDPWKLIVKSKDGNFVRSHKTIHAQCKLSDGTYGITIGPLPGNGSLQGMCGGFMTAWAEVRRGTEMILPRHSFEYGDCNTSQPVTTKIIIESGSKKPVIEKMSWDDFYNVKHSNR